MGENPAYLLFAVEGGDGKSSLPVEAHHFGGFLLSLNFCSEICLN